MSGDHSHESRTDRAFIAGLVLNTLLVIVELFFGLMTHSMALLADAGHNLTDVAALALAWGARYIARKAPTERHTYGYRRITIYSSLLSAMLLIATIGILGWESFKRLLSPQPVDGHVIVWVACIGVAINAGTAYFMHRSSIVDLNVKGAFLHMMLDAGASLGAAIAGLLIIGFGWTLADPLIGLVLVAVIFYSVWHLAKDSLHLAMDAVPKHVDVEGVKRYLMSEEGVSDIHDLHIWAMSTTETAMTVHLVIPDKHVDDPFLRRIADALEDRFSIDHVTVQVERGDAQEVCRQEGHARV